MKAKLAMVYSRFHEPVTLKLLEGAKKRLQQHDYSAFEVPCFSVPGAFEMPLVAKKLAQLNIFDAMICLGVVIRGETSHYDYVCEQVSAGCQRVALDYGLPVIFGVLTTDNAQQAFDRAGGKHSDKGALAVDDALSMVQVLKEVNALSHHPTQGEVKE